MNKIFKTRPLSGKFSILKNSLGEKKKLIIQANNKLKTLKDLNIKDNNNSDKIETKLLTKTFAETKDTNFNNSSFNQLTEKTEFLEMLSKEQENDKEALDNIIFNEVNRIKNVNEKRKKLNEINLIEKNYDDLYLWENLFNNSRPLSHYTTLKQRKIEKLEENKDIEQFKSPIILVDLYEEQMNLYFGKKNFLRTNKNIRKGKSAKNKLHSNKNQAIKKNSKNQKNLTINTNIDSINNNTLKSKKSLSARNRIMTRLNSWKSQKNKYKFFHKYIRPMSVYSPRSNTCSFYFSNAFSDYYKEDLKSFSNKLKILKAKVKSNTSNLKHEIKEQRKIAFNKERKLKEIINSNKIVFDKEDLIIAADRKNPKPLLKSIFRINHPDKEVMKENIKMYFNTMKPMGNWDDSVDYTKNDRWGFCEKFSEMREGIKKEYNNKGIENNKNFILKYYNENDPYIKMFERMVKNRISFIKDLNRFRDKRESDTKNDYNPILSKVQDEFPFIKTKEFLNKNKEDIKPKIEINDEDNKNNINLDKRPKTVYKSVGSHINTNFKTYCNNYKNIKRPQTSNVKEIKMIDNNYYVPDASLEYQSRTAFPIKTSSNVGNVSYDKINQLLHERQFGLSKIKKDYFMTSTGLIKKEEKKNKYGEEKFISPSYKKNNKIYDLVDKTDLRLDCCSEKGNTPRDKIIWTEEYFKNFRNKYYSSSNNVHIKNKRKNKIELLNKYYTQSQYSNDEPEIEFIDRSVSSQANSFNRNL